MSGRLGRLKRRSEFLAVARSRISQAQGGLVLQMRRRVPAKSPAQAAAEAEGGQAGLPDLPDIRIGFTASKKVGNAVIRNRCKRRLRALADEILATGGQNGHDYVLIARQSTAERSFEDLRHDLKRALMKVHQPRKARPSRGNAGIGETGDGEK